MVKHSIGDRVKEGWTHVAIPPDEIARLFDKGQDRTWEQNVKWCKENVPADEWISSFVKSCSSPVYDQGTTRFAFKDEKYAAWFQLMTN